MISTTKKTDERFHFILLYSLATGKTPREMMMTYLRLKDKVFVDTKPYDTKKMEELLQQEFGLEHKMSDIKEPRY